MLLHGPCDVELRVSGNQEGTEFATVTSPAPTTVDVYFEGELIDRVHVGAGTHTWWNTNPLFPPQVTGKARVVIEGPATMRIQWPVTAK